MATAAEPILSLHRHAEDLRQTWQGRVLSDTRCRGIGAVVLSVLAHAFDAEVVVTLMRCVDPQWTHVAAPFICSAAKVHKTGTVVADVVWRDNRPPSKNELIFWNERDLRDAFRRLADRLKLNDQDRVELFTCVKRWVVADLRLDPTMDPADPDAKRLVH